MKFILIIAFVGLTFAAEYESETFHLEIAPDDVIKGSRIVNGLPASSNQFPHQALVYIYTLQGTFQCGGSLISSKWILSAAHCITNARQIQVLLGSINRNSMPVKRNGISYVKLNSYNPTTLRDDISLIQMDQTVPFSAGVNAIQLPSRSEASATYLNEILTVSGFGRTTANTLPNNLEYTRVRGISNVECGNVYGSMIISSMLCTRGYPNTNAGSCAGDSGGPLIKGTKVVGIVSFGASVSCTAGYPQGFTRVGSYLTFISQTTGIPLTN